MSFPTSFSHLASMADLVEITRQHERAMQIVHDLESSLVDANAEELYWRRLRRKAVAAGIAERMSDDTATRSDDDAPPVPEDIKKAEVAKRTVGGKMGEKEVEEKKTSKLKRALGKKPVEDKPAKSARPRRPEDECPACWLSARGKRPSIAHLWVPPCVRQRPPSGRWFKVEPEAKEPKEPAKKTEEETKKKAEEKKDPDSEEDRPLVQR